jgi:hypothetical protein
MSQETFELVLLHFVGEHFLSDGYAQPVQVFEGASIDLLLLVAHLCASYNINS